MEFFGIGAPELMVILIIAIVLFGPDKIPTMAAQVGKTIRDFRRYTSELTKEFNEATGGLKEEFQTIASDLRGELEATQAELRSQLDMTGVLNDVDASLRGAGVAAAPAVVAAESSSPAVATLEPPAEPMSAPQVTETITVTTPYADALAAASAAAAEAETILTNGTHVATKSDPFADLVALTDVAPVVEPLTITESAPLDAAPLEPDVASFVVSEPVAVFAANGSDAHRNGRAKVGGSVAGSKYARRKSE